MPTVSITCTHTAATARRSSADRSTGELFTPQDFILAWEDLFGGGDRDYQDFVVVVQDIRPVPLPPAVWLLASSLIGLAGVARRRA